MKLGICPFAIKLEGARAFRCDPAVFACLRGLKDGDQPLGGRLLRVRHMGGDTPGPEAGGFQRLALFL